MLGILGNNLLRSWPATHSAHPIN